MSRFAVRLALLLAGLTGAGAAWGGHGERLSVDERNGPDHLRRLAHGAIRAGIRPRRLRETGTGQNLYTATNLTLVAGSPRRFSTLRPSSPCSST